MTEEETQETTEEVESQEAVPDVAPEPRTPARTEREEADRPHPKGKRPVRIKHSSGATGEVMPSALPVWESRGWTAVDDKK